VEAGPAGRGLRRAAGVALLGRLLVLGLALGGCLLGPDYRRPPVDAPPEFRADLRPAPDPVSIADLQWFEVFQDEALQALVREALVQNYDVRIAAARVLQARAQLGVVRADLFPTVDAVGTIEATKNAENAFSFSTPSVQRGVGTLELSLSWELDFWGRLRRLTESARAQYLASEEGRRAVLVSLVADVATAYFQLRDLDLELLISRRTVTSRQQGLDLTRRRKEGGIATALDVAQAENLLYTATATIARLERQIEQQENLLSVLVGRNPGAAPRGQSLDVQAFPPEVPPGLPSALLERRPDIRQAEQSLVSANAEIGAAKARYFPQISLTGPFGVQSGSLGTLFTPGNIFYDLAAGATLPVFNAGRIRSGVELSEARKVEALTAYERAVRYAFREVSDALVGLRKTHEERGQQELLVGALRESVRLSLLRYQGGLDSYLQVLDAESRLFDAELRLAQLRRDELLAVVQLYRALGGGWTSAA
jgi:NodT family efflux transporter outer membrane factor (OMF) lipoprotein